MESTIRGLRPRSGDSKCTRCLDAVDVATFLFNDHLCDECAAIRDHDPRNFFNMRSHDATQEDAVNELEKRCRQRRKNHHSHHSAEEGSRQPEPEPYSSSGRS
jgi:hypothetical protein